MKRKIFCPICRVVFDPGDLVDLDIAYTITHKSCNTIYKIKDTGRFVNIINKYFKS